MKTLYTIMLIFLHMRMPRADNLLTILHSKSPAYILDFNGPDLI